MSNPYLPPSFPGPDAHQSGNDPLFQVPAATVDAGRGISWITEGWGLFKAAPVLWIVAMLLFWGVQAVLNLVPFIGGLINVLLGPIFMVGMLAFAHGIARGEAADIGNFLVGFQSRLGELATLAALYMALLLAAIVIGVLAGVALLGGTGLFSAVGPEQAMDLAMASGGLLAMLLVFLLVVSLVMLIGAAYWYAPGLVFFANLGAVEAMKQSFTACLRNWLPLLVYSLAGLVVIVLGAAALGIGLLVALPVLMASYYVSFRDFFGRTP